MEASALPTEPVRLERKELKRSLVEPLATSLSLDDRADYQAILQAYIDGYTASH